MPKPSVPISGGKPVVHGRPDKPHKLVHCKVEAMDVFKQSIEEGDSKWEARMDAGKEFKSCMGGLRK